MRLLPISVWLLASAGIHAQVHDIPAVDKLVSSVMNSLSAYTEFATPAATAAATAAVPTGNSTVHEHASFNANAAASYWLESINHQGIAAFNSNPSGYKVFRNVKDYGARGMFPFVRLTWLLTKQP